MRYFQEITVWSDGSTKNGQYYLDDSKTWMVAYQAPNTHEFKRFKSPIKIDKRGRKFQLIKDGEPDSVYFGKPAPTVTLPAPNSIEVEGSNGAKYYVSQNNGKYSCTCQGFQFRRKCKHTDALGPL